MRPSEYTDNSQIYNGNLNINDAGCAYVIACTNFDVTNCFIISALQGVEID